MEFNEEERKLIDEGQRMAAIKKWHDRTRGGVFEGKKLLDEYLNRPPGAVQCPHCKGRGYILPEDESSVGV